MRRICVCLLCAMSAAAQQPAVRDYGRLPLVFEPNQGQVDSSVKFMARAGGGMLFLTEREMVVAARGAKPVRMRLAGSRKPEAIHGIEPTGGISNYFIGNDPSKWRTKIPNYSRVEYKSVYAGVDLVYYGNPQKLEYDLVVAPGANARAIQVEYDGVDSLRVDEDGDLVLATSGGGELRQKRPVAYQDTAAGRMEVEVSYRLKTGRRVAFELARYDTGKKLVIDPVFIYSTYLGGSGDDQGDGIAVDGSGNAYVAGTTTSVNFPTTTPLHPANGGSNDTFVTKINATGSARVYSTYLGGSVIDQGLGIAVDGGGNAYVTGYTNSANFPTANPLQATIGGDFDAFVLKLNNVGSALFYSTYLGGSGFEQGLGIAVDGSGNAYVTGYTQSTNFPTANPLQASNGGGYDAFATKISATGSARLYSTYLGGIAAELAFGIAVDGSGNAYVTGYTNSTNFPTTNPLQASKAGLADAFVTKINTTGSAVYSTYLGGSGVDEGHGIAVDGSGNAYVTGYTESANFPTTNPLQGSNAGGLDVFVTKIDPAGSATVYSTYVGGSGTDRGFGIAVDGAGNAHFTGVSGADAYMTKINAAGSARVYSTLLGGSSSEQGNGIAVDGSGNAYVTGSTSSTNFPTTNPLQPSNGGSFDAFVLSISSNSPTAVFRDTDGAVQLTSELSSLLSNSGGAFASDPSASQNARGDTFVVARDAFNALWLNFYNSQSRSWLGWQFAGGNVVGNPSVTAGTTNAYLAARDSSNAYWFRIYTPGVGFGSWLPLGGAFVTDPVVATLPGQSFGVYVTGRDASNAIWSNFRTAGTFQGWSSGGAAAQGKPAVTLGQDGAAYIAIRDPSNSVWIGRFAGFSWTGWQPGGGAIASDPQIATAGTNVYAVALTASGAVWYNSFIAATGNNWIGWVPAGGTLSSVAAAANSGPQLFLTGRDAANQLWWYETPGAGWKFVGAQGVAAGPLSAAPR